MEFDTYDEKGKPVSTKLAEDEELNTEKLNALKTAIDDLKIVDVERKPTGLSRDLRVTDEFVNNNEAVRSLATRGFYLMMREQPTGNLLQRGRGHLHDQGRGALCAPLRQPGGWPGRVEG